ncbi:Imm49 family immunity protein [Basilea psittacipulmonis]|uniref:Imm49 family immunity protein n=1 Tax=Basilea psittacipulmonis TaxID=1472345 RepID=UPI000691D706|nr:Imm49 family immunity protein [Basilea psittacipulmonis]
MSTKQRTQYEKYKVFLGSDAGRNYEESVRHCLGRSNMLNIDSPYHEEVIYMLNIIKTGVKNPFFYMEQLGILYEARSSIDLLLHHDIQSFKQDIYVGGKLKILGREVPYWGNVGYSTMYAPMLLSDNPELKNFLIKQRVEITGDFDLADYRECDPYIYANHLTLLALSGEWEKLEKRSLQFLEDDTRSQKTKKIEPDYRFFLALARQDVQGMKEILMLMITNSLKRGKWRNGTNLWFDFYLAFPALTYAKIAMIHGYDLGIDSLVAPRELIEIKPLDHYEDPYDFMKEFDYEQPQEVWIEKWMAKKAEALARKEEEENRKFKNRVKRFFKNLL